MTIPVDFTGRGDGDCRNWGVAKPRWEGNNSKADDNVVNGWVDGWKDGAIDAVLTLQ